MVELILQMMNYRSNFFFESQFITPPSNRQNLVRMPFMIVKFTLTPERTLLVVIYKDMLTSGHLPIVKLLNLFDFSLNLTSHAENAHSCSKILLFYLFFSHFLFSLFSINLNFLLSPTPRPIPASPRTPSQFRNISRAPP